MSEPLNELIVIPKETALEVFTKEGSIEPYLEQIKAAVTGIVPDLSTKKGRDAIASLAYKVAKSKTYLDGEGKRLVDEYKEIPKKIDATRKKARDFLDQLKDEVRQPLTDWENAEKARVDSLKQRLAFFETVCQGLEDLSSAEIHARIAQVVNTEMGETWQEFASYAEQAKMGAERTLAAAFQKRQQYEAEQEELARLRREAEERAQRDREEQIRREAAEQAQREAEARQQAERDEAARKVREAEEATQRAEQERLRQQQENERQLREAEERAERAAEQERQRIAEEQRQAEEEARRREADREHRKAINTAALEAFMAEGIDKETAIKVITLIAQRKIPAISIQY
jgi:hypothetical protein